LKVHPTRTCELIVGLPEVAVLRVDDRPDGPIAEYIDQAAERPACLGCGELPKVKDRDVVELADLAVFGRPARLCRAHDSLNFPQPECLMTTWTWADPRMAAPLQAITDRAAVEPPSRWVA
jgi:hypothetical protein